MPAHKNFARSSFLLEKIMGRNNYLFSEYDLRGVVESHQKAMNDEIDSIDSNRLLNTNEEELVQYFKEKYFLPSPKLLEDKITIDQGETQIDVSNDPNRFFFDRSGPFYITGTKVSFFIPYDGDKDLFRCQSNILSMNPPRGTVTETDLVLTYQTTDHNADSIKNQFEQTLGQIRSYLVSIADGVSEFNNGLEDNIRQRIKVRKEKIMKDQGMATSFGFPLRKRENTIETYIAPEVKRKIVPRMPDPSTVPFKPEKILDMQEYEHILKVISDMVTVMERSPKAFENMDEETLRTQILVPLNGHYEGQATGETFNASGKTDILIRVDNKNIFIAECKIWRGQEYLKEAIDQILSYASWRDTKTSILIFNRNKNLNDVLSKIPDVMKQHPNFLAEQEYSSETGFRYKFHHNDDKSRELILTVLVFEVPVE